MSNLSEETADSTPMIEVHKELQKYVEFLDYLKTEFADDPEKSITKAILKKNMPTCMKTAAKRKRYIDQVMQKEISYDDIMEFLRLTQTSGKDFVFYPTLEKHYNLKKDKNGLTIFKKSFPYEDCKREALFISYANDIVK